MKSAERVTDDEIQEYLDERLPPERKRVVESYLAAHPERAVEVRALMRQQQALRKLGSDILDEPIPERFKEILGRLPTK